MLTRIATFSLLAGGLCAQSYFTSPAGLLTTEGSSNHNYILFRYNQMRWQQIDSTSVGTAYGNISGIAWRRDATGATNSAYAARTVDMVVLLADGVGVGEVGTDYDNNYLGTPTAVVGTIGNPRTVNLPDWTQQPPSAPAPFDAVVAFDQTWSYSGVNNLLWEVRGDNNSQVGTNYQNDFEATAGSFSSSSTGTATGTGCTATNRTSAFAISTTFYNYATSMEIRYSCTNAEPSMPVFAFLGFADPNLNIGLCANLRTSAEVSLPLGVSSSTGSVASMYFPIPYVAQLIGTPTFSQLACPDAGFSPPVILSSGRMVAMPADPSLPSVARVYQYTVNGTSLVDSGPWTGGIVTRFQY